MMSDFKTISKISSGEYKEKGSRFVAYAFPVTSEAEIKQILEDLWASNTGACHICYAYRLGLGQNEKYRANDDGEPSGSAGKPIYGQLLSFEITNSLVAVVRFYGGTKLGVGGLISAYKLVAKESILTNEIINKTVTKELIITFPYDLTSDVNRFIHQYELNVTDRIFESSCTWKLAIPVNLFPEILERVEVINGVEINR